MSLSGTSEPDSEGLGDRSPACPAQLGGSVNACGMNGRRDGGRMLFPKALLGQDHTL